MAITELGIAERVYPPLAEGERQSYSRLEEVLALPNLIQVQLESFGWFKREGLRELFEGISPIQDFAGRLKLYFEDYEFKKPKYSEDECRDRDLTYAAPLHVGARLVIKSKEGEVKELKSKIFMGDFPMMTPNGTFIINGAERVVVSQLVRSPGVYFKRQPDPTTGRELCTAKLIPNRGAWLEFETSNKDVLSVKVDRKRKIPVTTLLRAIGFGSDKELLDLFRDVDTNESHQYIRETIAKDLAKSEAEAFLELYRRLRPGDPPTPENAKGLVNSLFFNFRRYDLGKVGRYKLNKRLGRVADEVDMLLMRLREALSQRLGQVPEGAERLRREWRGSLIERLEDKVGPDEVAMLFKGLHEALAQALGQGPEEAARLLLEGQKDLVDKLTLRTLARGDFLKIVKIMIQLNNDDPSQQPDDIDHLGNRRVRAVGELIQSQFRVGLLRMERVIKERMSIQDTETATPAGLVNIRPVVAAVKEFFGSSQLSQFMDQTNPLAEITHKRRLSALGPGGLNRERAGMEVRDVHHSHYGRICPIETPEGPNIGLIGVLATYGRINEYGFIETPYRHVYSAVANEPGKLLGRTLRERVTDPATGVVIALPGTVIDGALAAKLAALPLRQVKIRPFVSDEIVFLTADEEDKFSVAQANARLNELKEFVDEHVEVRYQQGFSLESPDKVRYTDVSPKQIVSVATSLIPFLEHDDANRALMGSNMQRQAVPLLRPEAPVVGTGMERQAARDSGQVVLAEEDGEVVGVTARRIVVRHAQGLKEYPLRKFLRSNQGTCINQRPIVRVGDRVRQGQPLADSSSTDQGELALGQNVLVAFMSFEGLNFEDAIVISERIVQEDKFTSIHIEKHEVEARDTKLGPEEITRDIPNVGEEALRDLDEDGVIRLGAEVKAADILVGKITPKGETELSAEERLLRAIFGEKAREVKDTSLRVPHGQSGKVVEVRKFSRDNHDELPPGVNQMVRVSVAQKRKIAEGDKMAGRHGNKGVISKILPSEDMPFLSDGTPVEIILNPIGVPSRMNVGQILETHLGWAAETLGFKAVSPVFDGAKEPEIEDALARAWLVERANREQSDPLGRPDGGLGARRARTQEWLAEKGYEPQLILDRGLLGWAKEACLKLWLEDESLSAEGLRGAALEETAARVAKERNLPLPTTGKVRLYDGRTGEPFDQPVTVGSIYMMKLVHLVEDKIHARSTGPYSLITQQPLGGKAQFGGQRFGEMEVWALEAYGAAHILQEILTVKSDDVVGRVKTYEAIVKGDDILELGVPESFKVLVKELQSLGLAVEVLNEEEARVELAKAVGDHDEDLPDLDINLTGFEKHD